MNTPTYFSALPRPPFPVRWLAIFGLSLLLHVFFLQSVDAPSALFSREALPFSEPLPVTLAQAPRARLEPAPPSPPPKKAPRPKAAKRAASPAPASPPSKGKENIADTISEALAQLPAGTPFDIPADMPGGLPAFSTEEAAFDQDGTEETTATPAPQYQTSPLPSATLNYDVEALRDGNKVYGSGKIQWQSDGQNYAIDGEASVLFFTLLDFRSEGMIDDSGVSPMLYSQKRFRKAATHTHFQRERNEISFSAAALRYPRAGGEQDRASLIWQLAAIGRGDPLQFAPGKGFTLAVAGVRDMQTWDFTILGQEEVETGEGRFTAWRVIRIPPPQSHEQRLDIWLAPELGWYPVKLRHTDYNGEHLDMILNDLASVPAD